MKRHFACFAILWMLTAVLVAPHALGAGDVNECNETSLMLALESGGLVKLNCSGLIELSSEISIKHDTTIDGSGQDVQISAADSARIMQILSEDQNVTIIGVTLMDGLARTTGGGAILNRGNLTIQNAKFVNNRVETGIGGAIHNDGGTLKLINTEFTTNSADNGGSGGAVANSNEGVLIIEGGSFNSNTATSTTNGRGGAIYGISGKGTITITNTHFNNNIAHGSTEGGGAIYDDGPSEIIIEGAVFAYNSAPNANGGAIYNKGATSTTSIRDSEFSHNTAPTAQGGAIYAASRSEIAIGNTRFEMNSAQIGGGIYISSPDNTIVVVSQSTFSGNSATHVDQLTPQGGGAISNHGTLTITRSTLTENSAPDGSGGAISNHLKLVVVNTTMTGNSAAQGGAIRVTDNAILKMSYSTIVHNSALSSQRGAGIDSGDSVSAAVQIKNSIVAGSATGQDCHTMTLESEGANFDTDGSCDGFRKVSLSDLNLADLGNYRGNTESIALDGHSIAVDAAIDCTDLDENPVDEDQRGVPRAQGEACDAGAYELIDNPAALDIEELSEEVVISVKGEYAVPFSCGMSMDESGEYPFEVEHSTEIEIEFPKRDKFLGIFPRRQLTAQFIESLGLTEIGVNMPESDRPVGIMSQIRSVQRITLSCADLLVMPTQVNAQGMVIQSLNGLIETGDYFAGKLGIQSDRTELRIYVTEKVVRTEILPPDATFEPLEPENIEQVTPIYPDFVDYDESVGLRVSHRVSDVEAEGMAVAASQAPVRFSTASFGGRAILFKAQAVETQEVGVQIYSLNGLHVYSDQAKGHSLMWRMRDMHGRAVANGVYLYVVTAIDAHGNVVRSGVKKIAVMP